jgi:hypothetical protein
VRTFPVAFKPIALPAHREEANFTMRLLITLALLLTVHAPALEKESYPGDRQDRPALVDALSQEVDRRIATTGLNPGPAIGLFSTADDTAFVYKRNPSCWAHDLDLTGVVIAHDYLSQGNHLTSGGALITPQDVVCAAHFTLSVGAVLYFVDAANALHTGKIVGGAPVPGTDIYLCHLAAPVAGVKSYKVLPPDYTACSPGGWLRGWPILLAYNFGHSAFLLDSDGAMGELHFHPCLETARAPYTLKIGSGSGSPAFAVLNGEPILVGCLHTTGTTSWIASNETAVNATLQSLGSTYTLTTVDLTKPIAYARY